MRREEDGVELLGPEAEARLCSGKCARPKLGSRKKEAPGRGGRSVQAAVAAFKFISDTEKRRPKAKRRKRRLPAGAGGAGRSWRSWCSRASIARLPPSWCLASFLFHVLLGSQSCLPEYQRPFVRSAPLGTGRRIATRLAFAYGPAARHRPWLQQIIDSLSLPFPFGLVSLDGTRLGSRLQQLMIRSLASPFTCQKAIESAQRGWPDAAKSCFH
jgi:hypothetical protein